MTTYHFIKYIDGLEQLLEGQQYLAAYYEGDHPFCQVSVSRWSDDDVAGLLVINMSIDNELRCYLTLASSISSIESGKLSIVLQTAVDNVVRDNTRGHSDITSIT